MSVKQAPTWPASCFKHRVLGVLRSPLRARLTGAFLRPDVEGIKFPVCKVNRRQLPRVGSEQSFGVVQRNRVCQHFLVCLW